MRFLDFDSTYSHKVASLFSLFSNLIEKSTTVPALPTEYSIL